MTVRDENEITEKNNYSEDSEEEPRIGVYICHCGHNIAGTVDVADVAEFASNLPNVVEAKHYMFMCSKQGVQLLKDAIKEEQQALNNLLQTSL